MTDTVSIPERLKEIREERNLSKAAAARLLNLSKMGYLRYETGDRTPSYQTIVFMAQKLGTSPEYLTGLKNHDNPRSVNRFSIDVKKYRYEAATMLAAVMYMGYGTPFIYMGQEVGLTNCDFKGIDEVMDPVSHFVYELMASLGIPKWLALRFIKYGARDHSRLPIAWDNSANGGFNGGQAPWQCVNPLYTEINVKKDLESKRSVYRFYQKLFRIRKKHEEAVWGEVREYDHESRRIIAYSRMYQGKRLFVCANFSRHTTIYKLPDDIKKNKVILNNYDALGRNGEKVRLRPYQAVILRY
jgi:glycosidase